MSFNEKGLAVLKNGFDSFLTWKDSPRFLKTKHTSKKNTPTESKVVEETDTNDEDYLSSFKETVSNFVLRLKFHAPIELQVVSNSEIRGPNSSIGILLF